MATYDLTAGTQVSEPTHEELEKIDENFKRMGFEGGIGEFQEQMRIAWIEAKEICALFDGTGASMLDFYKLKPVSGLTVLVLSSLTHSKFREHARKTLANHATDTKYAEDRKKKQKLFEIWKTGKYKFHTHCAKCEHERVGLSESAALDALRKEFPKKRIK